MTYHKAVFWCHKAPTQDIHWNRNTLGLHRHFRPAKRDPLGLPHTSTGLLQTSAGLAETTVDPRALQRAR